MNPSPQNPHNLPLDTVVALSTGRGQAALAVVRLSGPRAHALIAALSGKESPPHGRLVRRELPGIDDVMVVCFYAPRSYTGEALAEIHCHGSPVIVDRLIEALTEQGARAAEPGEFTYRAVLNGKMTLSDAERLNARIHATSRASLALLEGSPKSVELLEQLLSDAQDALADLESHIEFEEGEPPPLTPLAERLAWLRGQASLSRKNAELPIVLLYGPPNCGKSTLFNAIIGFERALVSDTPGTTRDYIEADFYYHGTGFRLVDSAGMREATDAIEAQGVSMTLGLYENAAAVVHFAPKEGEPYRVIPVAGKADAPAVTIPAGVIGVSGTTRQGIDELLMAIRDRVESFKASEGWEIWVSSSAESLLEGLQTILSAAMREPLAELRAHHLTQFCEKLRVDIDQPSIDLYDRIFSRFCIGK